MGPFSTMRERELLEENRKLRRMVEELQLTVSELRAELSKVARELARAKKELLDLVEATVERRGQAPGAKQEGVSQEQQEAQAGRAAWASQARTGTVPP